MPIAVLSSSQTDSNGRAYPRPQLQRPTWISLNGAWEFELDPNGRWREPAEVEWKRQIRVPFAPEAQLSGVGLTGFFRACWYRRQCELLPRAAGERWLLHFGAVDWRATVWINGAYAG